jgi:DNA/RNA-binding domain of Phe-tRNA-synthetase-like protein
MSYLCIHERGIQMIDIKISEKLKEKCPQVTIGCIEATVTVESGNEELWNIIDEKCKSIEERYEPEDILKIKNIVSSRKAYKALGKDPSRYRLSSESLVKRIVKGNGLYKVNNVVDINNLISLNSCYSVGTYDLENINCNIEFTVGNQGDYYEGIGRGPINLESLPVFKDKDGYFGSTTSDSTRAMITESTKHIIMNIISFNGDEELKEHMDYAINLLEKYAGGRILNVKIV